MLIKRLGCEFIEHRSAVLFVIAGTLSLFCPSASASAQTEPEQPASSIETEQRCQEPDVQIVFRALEAIRNRRFERGRALLRMLIFADSPLMPVARLITADSYYREGGYRNFQNALAQYFEWLELFPRDRLAPQVMVKVVEIDLRLGPSSRDASGYEFVAERTLQKLHKQFPEFESSEAADYLDAVQEIISEHELKVARFYLERREAVQAAEMRCLSIVEKRTRFTKLDEVLWHLATIEEAEENPDKAIEHYGRIVRDHPNSVFRTGAESRLAALGGAVPEPNPIDNEDPSARSARIARVLSDLQGQNAIPPGRAIVLNEWNQVDAAFIYDLTNRAGR